jgi:hypothetical protein
MKFAAAARTGPLCAPTLFNRNTPMTRCSSRSLLLALAFTALPAALSAQAREARQAPVSARRPAPSATKSPQAQAMLSELQMLNAKLEALQARALQDPQLMAAQQSLGTTIKAAMGRLDPTLEQSLVRGKQLQEQAVAAQRIGDDATLQRLTGEMQQIQQRFFAIQQRVLTQPAVAAQLKVFQDRVQKKMATLDTTAPTMIARFGELQSKLAAMNTAN